MRSDVAAGGSLARRASLAVRLPLDGPAARDALAAVAATYADSPRPLSDLARHRDLRADMQVASAQMDREFAQSLADVDSVFGDLERAVDSLDRECTELRKRVNEALRCTAATADHAALLVDERRELAARRALAAAFVERFASTAAAVTGGGSVDTSQDLIADLDAVAGQRAECQPLMAVSAQPAVRDLLSDVSAREDAAYAALLRWVLREIHTLARDAPEPSARLRLALDRLAPRAALFQSAIDEIVSVRHDSVARAFVSALVQGGPGGVPRPIEAHAGDPQRYVGDMLAWVHQACASERDLLDSLLPSPPSNSMTANALASALDGVARPLEIRVDQTIAEIRSPAVLHRIARLLDFYRDLFATVVSSDSSEPASALAATILTMCETTDSRLRGALGTLTDTAINDLDSAPSPTLEPPQSLAALLAVIFDILRLQLEDPTPSAAAIINDVVILLLERVLAAAHDDHDTAATAAVEATEPSAQHLRTYEQSILELNILCAIIEATASFDYLDEWRVRCITLESQLVETLATQLVDILKRKSRLPFDHISLHELPEVLESFNSMLKTASDLDVARLVVRLQSQQLARSASLQAIEMFVSQYDELHRNILASITEDDSGIRNMLLAPETVSTLL
ncbi:Golgi transport complex subunit 6 [Coemansia sp. RSA 2399]|nr:Golgi transport complex subunit 6 [Coemansia sp. RSA 2399]KAJ1904289.1 Golgi transport complex subunit 6 [Coemansia sp. IMI 209127]